MHAVRILGGTLGSRFVGRVSRLGIRGVLGALAVVLVAGGARAQSLGMRSTPAKRESPSAEMEHRPDTSKVLVGSGMFGVPYLAGVGFAALREAPTRGMEPRALYVPIFGPLLAIRGVGCDNRGNSSCSTDPPAGVWVLLLLDSVIQGTGVAMASIGLANTEPVAAHPERQSVRVVPHSTGADRLGLSVIADF